MKRIGLVLTAATWLLAAVRPALAQFTPEELARRPHLEELLSTAPIQRSEPIGEGVTKPYAVYLQDAAGEHKACWKNPSGIKDGFLEGWQYEIAAYRLDKLLGLNMIPPTVEREFEGRRGALSYWAPVEMSLLKKEEKGIAFPDAVLRLTDDMKYLARAWDSLIGNEDRTQQNVLYTADWRTILIDHSRAFRSSADFRRRLMFGKNGIKTGADGRPFLFRRLPRAFVAQVKALDFESIKDAVGSYLSDEEIEAVVDRRDLLLAEIDDMIKQNGEDKVLY